MRDSISNVMSQSEQDSQPMLTDTLAWLQEKIPLASVNYVETCFNSDGDFTTASVHAQGTVTSIESCTVKFGEIERDVFTIKRPDGSNMDVGELTATSEFTVPVGIITEAFAEPVKNVDRDSERHPSLVSADMWAYVVVLRSRSVELSIRRSVSGFRTSPPATKTVAAVALRFSDHPLAHRVAEVFQHASILCRKREPF